MEIARKQYSASEVANNNVEHNTSQQQERLTPRCRRNLMQLYDASLARPAPTTTQNISVRSVDERAQDASDKEMTEYTELNWSQSSSPHWNVLEFWKEYNDRFPLMTQLAKQIFAIPATSAAAETNFSAAGHILCAKRAQLNSCSLEAMLVIRSNIDLESNFDTRV